VKLWHILAAAGGGGALLLARSAHAMTKNDTTGSTLAPMGPEARAVVAEAREEAAEKKTLGPKAVEVLLRDLGAKEDPPGSNRGPVIDRIILGVKKDGRGLLGKPWCARAARWAYDKAAEELGLPPPFASIKSSLALVSDWKKYMKDYELRAPKVGAAALRVDQGKSNHATIVARVLGDDLYTVEGNHKHAVALVKRKKSAFNLFLDVEAFARAKSKDKSEVSGYLVGTSLLTTPW